MLIINKLFKLSIILVFTFHLRAFGQDIIVGKNGESLTQYLNFEVTQDLSQIADSNHFAAKGIIFIQFKLNEEGSIVELSFIEASNNCKTTPSIILGSIKTALLDKYFHLTGNKSSYMADNESYYLLPLEYNIGSSSDICDTNEVWQNIHSWYGIKYMRLKEVYIEIK